jgi:hypothetical protein
MKLNFKFIPFRSNSSLIFCVFILSWSLFAALFSLLLLHGCQQGITPLPIPLVTLTAVEVGVTDVTLKLTVTNANDLEQISIERNGKEIRQIYCLGDSIVLIQLEMDTWGI